MADFAALINAGAQKTAESAGDGLAESYQKGAQLAQAAEDNQIKKAQLQHQKKQLMETKLGKFTEFLFKAQEAKDPAAKKNYMKAAPRVRDAYEISPDVFSDEAIAAFGASDDDAGRAYTLALAVKDPNNPLFGKSEEAMRMYNDPEKRVKITPTPVELRTDSSANISDSANKFLEYQAQQAQRTEQKRQFGERMSFDKEKDFTDKKQKLNKDLEDRALNDMELYLRKIEKMVPELNAKDPNGKLKGVTGIAANIPIGYLSDENSELRQTALSVLNARLKKMSGQAVTSSELPRLASSLGMKISPLEGGGMIAAFTGTPSPEQFVRGMRMVRASVERDKAVLKNTYGEDVFKAVVADANGGSAPASKPASPTGLRDLSELDDDVKAAKLRTIIELNPKQLEPAAARYGLSPKAFKKLIGGQ